MLMELLVGPIASGKSTYSREAANKGAVIINDDAIVQAVHGGNYRLYKTKLKPLYKSVENQIIAMAFSLGQAVIIDRPNHSRRMRQRYIGLGHAFDAKVRIVLFKRECPETHAERRANNDGRAYGYRYWLNVARRHQRLYEPPDQEIEGYDELVEAPQWK